MKRFIKVFFVLASIAVVTFFLIFKKIDKKYYSELPFYSAMMSNLEKVKIDTSSSDILRSGWSREPIVPSSPLPPAGYGLRSAYSYIYDSAFVSAFYFSNGKNDGWLVTADLLIFPPLVVSAIQDSLGTETSSHIFYSATHTHNGPGGWLDAPAARFFTGAFNKKFSTLLIRKTLSAIKKAKENALPVRIGYGEAVADSFVCNRVVYGGQKDSVFRYLELVNTNNDTAYIASFAAHSNCLGLKNNCLSSDYPGRMRKALERSPKSFAVFCAGAVGSMGNKSTYRGEEKVHNFDSMREIGYGLARRVIRDSSVRFSAGDLSFNCGKIPLLLKEPCPRLWSNWTIRPGVFDALLGKQEVCLSYLSLGNVVFIGTPCDFSGILSIELHKLAKQKHIHLFLTSFNGGYIGYITPDEYDTINSRETMEMNWYGPYSGGYMKEIITRLMRKF